MYTSAVFIYNANLDDRPYPGRYGQVAEGQNAETNLPHGLAGISGVEVGDEVTIIGETPTRKITAWEHASLASTIPYEILCGISSRLPRKYIQ